jgi:hypothetical protein
MEDYEKWMKWAAEPEPSPIPDGAMRVAPGSDAVVWNYLAALPAHK